VRARVLTATIFVHLLASAAGGAPNAPGTDDVRRLAFLAGDWRQRGGPGGAVYRWQAGASWLRYDVQARLPDGRPYEVAGGVTFDPGAGAYVAHAVDNLSPRVLEYRGRWTDGATLVFDGVRARQGRRQRIQYRRGTDGTVVFSSAESTDGRVYRPYFEVALVRTEAASLGALATAIQKADYEGDRAELRRLVQAADAIADPSLEPDRAYWRGFAAWRRALNGFNETPAPSDLAADLEQAVQAFRAALAARPGWIEAKVGIVGAQASLLFLAADDPPARRRILAEYVPVMRQMAAEGAENPRALWLLGGIQLGAPPPHGGDAPKAAATFARGLDFARREARASERAPAHVPSWGAAENFMSLAYLHSRAGGLPDRPLALAYARGALALVPHWRYVADVLRPQIEALGSPAAPTPRVVSVAVRVHHLPAMTAFYTEAFGFRFREVETRGTRSQFGTLGGVELKLVPIRERAEFERFPIHQVGFEVPGVADAVAAAVRAGGRIQDPPVSAGGRVRASVRDPDGNTVEIEGPR
jgi:catechol 2,3-dioxygenase-like lactoylglutathione lyase family enzyme